jgi:Mn-dependent DtxR family transcriptional regulator
VDVLGVPPKEAAKEVHRLEHVISDDVLSRLEALVDFAVSSGGWIKRLRLRIKTTQEPTGDRTADSRDVMVGESRVHAGKEQEG